MTYATGVDTSNLASKWDFIALKSEADKLDINKLVNFQSSFDNLKTKIWFGWWYVENCSVDLKKLSDAVIS